MRKHGYTLAEILIALGVVGVIAALMLPIFNKIKPDQNKAMYLKAYHAVTTAVSAIASDRDIYPSITSGDEYDYSHNPLYNTAAVENVARGLDLPSGAKKFGNALAWAFGSTVVEGYDASKKYKEIDNTGFIPTFKTKNGMEFMVSTAIADDKTTYSTQIWVDIDGSKGKNCIIGNNCPNPDRFKFVVSSTGQTAVADSMGESYVSSRHNLKKGTNSTELASTEKKVMDADEALAKMKQNTQKDADGNYTGIKDTLKKYTEAKKAIEADKVGKKANEIKPEEILASIEGNAEAEFLDCHKLGNCINEERKPEVDPCSEYSEGSKEYNCCKYGEDCKEEEPQEDLCAKYTPGSKEYNCCIENNGDNTTGYGYCVMPKPCEGKTGKEYDCCMNPNASGCGETDDETDITESYVCREQSTSAPLKWDAQIYTAIGVGKNTAQPNYARIKNASKLDYRIFSNLAQVDGTNESFKLYFNSTSEASKNMQNVPYPGVVVVQALYEGEPIGLFVHGYRPSTQNGSSEPTPPLIDRPNYNPDRTANDPDTQQYFSIYSPGACARYLKANNMEQYLK